MPNRRAFVAQCGRVSLAASVASCLPWAGTLCARDQEPSGGELPTTGELPPGLKSFDDLLRSFLAEHQVPGAALAVTRGGKLMLARGYGYADLKNRQTVQPSALFRVASISKPLTAVAVLHLAERGKIELDGSIHRQLGLPGPTDMRWQHVTVRQLLQHTGGWDRDASFDPMFRSVKIAQHFGLKAPASPTAIIRYMLEQPLDFDPGTRFAYSNFGYCLLGRLIEKVQGKRGTAYGPWMQANILAPLGIRRMKLGRTLANFRDADEVVYHTRKDRTVASVFANVPGKVPVPYGAWCLEAMDSHGGWIASAVDLARFAASLDNPAKCPVLNSDSIATMFARPKMVNANGGENPNPPNPVYYGCGWSVRQTGDGINTWHTGSLDGTSTLLVRRRDGLNWVVLFNTRDSATDKPPAVVIDPLLHKAADAVERWPERDLFADFS